MYGFYLQKNGLYTIDGYDGRREKTPKRKSNNLTK